MKTAILLGTMLAVGALILLPAADARPLPGPDDLPCDAYVSPTHGYVACCPIGVWVSYGGTFYCVPPR